MAIRQSLATVIGGRLALGGHGVVAGVARTTCTVGRVAGRLSLLMMLAGAMPVAALAESLSVDLHDAAARGNPQALFEIGAAYETGSAVPHDLKLAAHYFKLAADRGHQGAQYRLGLLYLAGAGVEHDPAEAYRWLALAAGEGDETSLLAEVLKDVSGRALSAQDLEEIWTEVAAFVAERGPVQEPAHDAGVAAVPDAPELAAALAEQVRLMNCGEPELTESEAGLRITSFVPEDADPEPLAATLRAITDARLLTLELTEIELRLCTVVELLDGKRPGLEPLDGVVLRDASGETGATFSNGDQLIVDIPFQPGDRFISVDYFVHDGQVLHMVASSTIPENEAGRGGRLTFGTGNGQEWVIGPPFGNDLLVVFTTTRRLFEGRRPEVEPTADYVRYLRSRLAQVPRDETIRVATHLVRTEEG